MENICEPGWGETRSKGGAKPGASASLRQLCSGCSKAPWWPWRCPCTGAASFQNNKFLPELFQTDHNQARPAGNEADTACDIVTCLNFILGTIKFIAWAQSPIICDVNTSAENKDTQLHSDRGMAENLAHMMSKLDDITQA